VFRSADEGLMVLNRVGDVVLHNARAAELGVVRGGRPDARAIAACQKVLDSGTPVDVDLSPLDHRGRQPAAVLAHVRPLGDGYTMVEAGDTSDAVRLEATRRDFVANVSHELKTPVGAVGLLAEAVLDAVDDPAEVRRFGTKILNEATRLGNLVTELIALSRLTGAERLPELCVVDVDEVVHEALARSRLSAEAASIEIIVDRPTGLEVEGDLTLLVTALSNLVENAIAYSPAEASVSVSRRRVGEHVEIAVTDRGIGIATEHQKRVFERFFRVDPARSRATGGTGLGLAIVKHVLANHGGEVRLWSSPGTGSTFTMRLPVRVEETDDTDDDGAQGPAVLHSTELPDRVG
jgi:two-component system, OmpR family, sensor histidine kinase SenX3